MRQLFLLFILFTLCSFTQAAAPLPAPQPTEQEALALHSAEATGLALFRHDRAADKATDAALAIGMAQDKRVRGWVTQDVADQVIVTFVDQARTAALYRVAVSVQGKVVGAVDVLDPPRALSDFEAGAARALAAAKAAPFKPCVSRYNSVVLPAAEDNQRKWVVYLLPATTNARVIPMGGAYRMEVDGETVTAQRGYTKSCVTLQGDPAAAALMVSHLMDPLPTEIHVFWSLWSRLSLYVLTAPNANLWEVGDGKMKLVERNVRQQERE